MDGRRFGTVIYCLRQDSVIIGALPKTRRPAITELKRRGYRCRFITTTSTLSRASLHDKLTGPGFGIAEYGIISAPQVALIHHRTARASVGLKAMEPAAAERGLPSIKPYVKLFIKNAIHSKQGVLMKYASLISIGILLVSAAAPAAEPVGSERVEEVQQQSREAVPYSLDQTLQSFTKTVHGGVQHVVVKPEADKEQIKLVQEHLRELTNQFRKGDFSATQRVHGADMPGLAQLKKAALDDIKYEYESLPNGAQIHFSTEYPQYVQALHEWFDAQSSDHGKVEVPEHTKHHSSPSE